MTQSDYVTACCLGKRIVILNGLKEVCGSRRPSAITSISDGTGEHGQQFGCVNSRQERPINIYDCNTSSTRYK